MSVKAGYATPMFHAVEIEKSIAFYERPQRGDVPA